MDGIKQFSLLSLLILGITVAGCLPAVPRTMESPLTAQSPIATSTLEPSPAVVSEDTIAGTPSAMQAPMPDPGRASLTGVLYTYTGHAPIPDTTFYLMLMREGDARVLVTPNEEKGDIRGRSDLDGKFVLNNVPPGKYNLVVWAPYQLIEAVKSPSDTTPLTITLEGDQRVALGNVNVSWP
jgi:hypothetical protein